MKNILDNKLSRYELEDFLCVFVLAVEIVFGWWVVKDFWDSISILFQEYMGDEGLVVFAYSVMCSVGGLILLAFSLPLAWYARRLPKNFRKITVAIPLIYLLVGIAAFAGCFLKSYMH